MCEKWLLASCLSVCLPNYMEQLSFDQMHFHEILRCFIKKSVNKIQVWLKLHRKNRLFAKTYV